MSDVRQIVKPRPDLYICKRTSSPQRPKDVPFSEEYLSWWRPEKPCEEAFAVFVIATDVRDCDDPKKIPINQGTNGDWYEKGTNHRVEGGVIKRDIGVRAAYAVELQDLQALQAFVDKYGSCVIDRDAAGYLEIEIYDDLREQ